MKWLFIFLMVFLSSFANTQTFVHLQHHKLHDALGKNLQLNGVNLGGWLLWEGWIWGSGFTKELEVKARLQELLGAAAYPDFLKAYYNSFISEKDIQLIAQSGFNCIRLPFNYRLLDAAQNNGIDGLAIMDKVVQWCRTNQIYLILDMHATPGGQSNYFIADPEKTNLWKSATHKAATIALWKKIAARYAREPVIAGYDLMNEPDAPSTNELVAFYKELVAGVRTVDTNHLLIIEGNKLAHTFKGFPESLDNKSIYSFHYYAWFNEKNKAKALKDIVQSIPGSAPVWCGEWGEDTPANLDEIKTLLDALPNSCGTAFWTWKRVYKNNGRSPLCSVGTGSNWNRLASWLTFKIVKPKANIIQKGISEFLNAVLVENCTKNAEVKAAVVR